MKRWTSIALLLLCACATTTARQEPQATIDAFLNALNFADPNIADLFTDDATVFFPLNDRPLRANGREEIAASFASLFGMPGYRKGGGMPKPEELRVQRAGDAAIVTFQTTNPNVTSRRTFVLRRDGASWRIVHLHGSNVRKE